MSENTSIFNTWFYKYLNNQLKRTFFIIDSISIKTMILFWSIKSLKQSTNKDYNTRSILKTRVSFVIYSDILLIMNNFIHEFINIIFEAFKVAFGLRFVVWRKFLLDIVYVIIRISIDMRVWFAYQKTWNRKISSNFYYVYFFI